MMRVGVTEWLMIGLAGAVGVWLRYGIGLGFAASRLSPGSATLCANVTGSLLIGCVAGAWVINAAPGWRAAMVIGLLGGLTTFSTFSLQTLELMQSGAWLRAGGNVVANVALCLAACAIGLWLGRLLRPA